jgi:hypothetical protein
VVTVRLHRGSPPALLRKVAEVLKKGGGMPLSITMMPSFLPTKNWACRLKTRATIQIQTVGKR